MQNETDLAPFEAQAPIPEFLGDGPLEQAQPTAEKITLPHNSEAESSLLGAIMIDGRVIDRVAGIVRADDFYHEISRNTFEIVMEMADKDQEVDPITVAEAWKLKGHDLERIQNGALFTQWANEIHSQAMAVSWAKIIADKARLRGLIDIGMKIADLAFQGQASTDAIEKAEALVLNERQNAPTAATVYQIGLDAISKDPDRSQIALRPFKKHVAAFTGPVCSTDLIVLAGRPATGKTAKALELLLRLSIEGIPVLFLSLEMSRDQIFYRLVAMMTGVYIPRDERERRPEHEEAMAEASVLMRKIPFYIDDGADLTPRSLRWKIRRYRKQHGIQFVVLDYLQLLQGDSSRENDFETVTKSSKACKAAAKENKVGIIALSQMNRDIEKTNRRPKVSDLRQSGQIEQDADLILFLHAPGNPESRGTEWIVENLCLKNRHGSTGMSAEVFTPSRMAFSEASFADKARLGYEEAGSGSGGPYGRK